MNTVELFEQAVELANTLGWKVRQEYLGGAGGGSCHCKGEKWIFIDLAISPAEQLEQITEALQSDPGIHTLDMQPQLGRKILGRAA